MARAITLQEATERWVRNSIRANPDRIQGIIRAYMNGRQSLRWAAGLLESEEASVVFPIAAAFKAVNPLKYNELMAYLEQRSTQTHKRTMPVAT